MLAKALQGCDGAGSVMAAGPAGTTVLVHLYDRNQHWLPFDTFIFRAFSETPPSSLIGRHNASLHKLAERTGCQWARPETWDKKPPELERDQYPLSIPGACKINSSYFKRVKAAGYPGWDLIEGVPSRVDCSGNSQSGRGRLRAVEKWCNDTCVGLYYLHGTSGLITFQKEAEAVMLKLVVSSLPH